MGPVISEQLERAIETAVQRGIEKAIETLSSPSGANLNDPPLTTNETLKALKISRSKLYELISANALRPHRVGTHLRFPAAQVRRLRDQTNS